MVVALTGCGNPAPNPAARGEIAVFADASLTEVFTIIGRDYEAGHEGTKVTFTFLGSSTLVQRINQGAPADVFASASSETMDQVDEQISQEVSLGVTIFARNQLVIAVAKGNPKGVAGLADLANPRLRVAVCAEPVPCGSATRRALAAGGVRLTPAVEEQDVKAALARVRAGEVDAAVVYRTDIRTASSDVDSVEFPESVEARNDYAIAALKNGRNPELAEAFMAYVITEPGRHTLFNQGFPIP
jgi:molybdate transport system substrate-binding protein